MNPFEFIDTNIFLRYLTSDNPDQSQKARTLMKELEKGDRIATTSESVLCEVVWVLSSKALYNLPRKIIKHHLTNILMIKGLTISHKSSYIRALDLYANYNVDFIDALTVAHMERQGIHLIWTFDKDFRKFKTVEVGEMG